MNKSINYLATPLERQRQFKIPEQQKIRELIRLTEKVKQAWQPLLPDEILDTLMVVSHDPTLLMLTTTNHTIANHLNYTYQLLVELLHEAYPFLQTISHLKFNVINLDKNNLSSQFNHTNINSVENNTEKRHSGVTNVTSRKLSATTRQNITQLAHNVTLNPRLTKALLRLANDD